MKLFQRREYDTPEEKRLSVVRLGALVLSIFSFVVPFSMLYVINREGADVARPAGTGAFIWAYVLKPSLITCLIVVAISLVLYFGYRAILLSRAKGSSAPSE